MRNVPIERAPAAESALRELAYTRHSSTAGGLLETEALLGLARGIATDVPALMHRAMLHTLRNKWPGRLCCQLSSAGRPLPARWGGNRTCPPHPRLPPSPGI